MTSIPFFSLFLTLFLLPIPIQSTSSAQKSITSIQRIRTPVKSKKLLVVESSEEEEEEEEAEEYEEEEKEEEEEDEKEVDGRWGL